jgi:predicted ArsR family transcriptional regulator
MESTKHDQRFFDSTRGRVVTLLRGGASTVEELAESLELTDNAVRAHLITLERDGLVQQSGVRRGARKPHFTYSLTSEAEKLFPKAYDALLNQLIAVLKGRLDEEEVIAVLRQVGRDIAAGAPSGQEDDLESRAQRALAVLAAIGGAAELEKLEDKFIIHSNGCPLVAAVSVHPEVCQLAETLVSEIVKAPVRERCDRTSTPRCRFEIEARK